MRITDEIGQLAEVDLRVTLTDVAGFANFNGGVLWVGRPTRCPDENKSDPDRTFTGALLQCEPFFYDWGTIALLNVFGGNIVPGPVYDVSALSLECADSIDDPAAYSAPLTITTGLWGDVVAPFAGDDPGAPQPDFNNIRSLVTKILSAYRCRMGRARRQLTGRSRLSRMPRAGRLIPDVA